MESSSESIKGYLKQDTKVFNNVSTDQLLEYINVGCDGCVKTGNNFAVVDSGDIKGRLPDDKYVVTTKYAKKNVWWADRGSDNKPLSRENAKPIREMVCESISSRDVYIVDGYYNNDKKHRLAVRFVTNIAWAAYFFRLISIEPTKSELDNFEPQWTILHSPESKISNYVELGMNSENAIITNLKYRETIVVGTYYLTEITKSMLSAMSYYLSLNNIGVFNCAVGVNADSKSIMFFGLSGSGKSTLAASGDRTPVSTDATSWSEDGLFGLEGGFTVKTASYNREDNLIQKALKVNVLAENPNFNENGDVIFGYKNADQHNTYLTFSRDSVGFDITGTPQPDIIIFLAKDSKGILPRVSKLTKGQAIYHLLSGYTSTSVGIESGVNEPQLEFSSCYSQPFLLLEPTRYAKIFRQHLKKIDAKVYLINVGWIQGDHKTGVRVPIDETKKIVDYLVNTDSNVSFVYKRKKYFNLKSLSEIHNGEEIIKIDNLWDDSREFKKQYKEVAKDFIKNYEQFTDCEFAQKYAKFGPKI